MVEDRAIHGAVPVHARPCAVVVQIPVFPVLALGQERAADTPTRQLPVLRGYQHVQFVTGEPDEVFQPRSRLDRAARHELHHDGAHASPPADISVSAAQSWMTSATARMVRFLML